MSTDEEIREVYLTDIADQSKFVREKHGIYAFYKENRDMRIHSILPVYMKEFLLDLAETDAQEGLVNKLSCAKDKI